jgi:radical SAM-linked protein
MKFDYRMHFSKTGRARFVAHLDTLSCLVRAVRRAGFELAYTEGMRPKPVLSLAMPLGVGVEGEDEICDFSLRQRAPLTELAKRLGGELPQGIELKSVGPSMDRTKSASRVEELQYRILLPGAPPGLEGAIERFNKARELSVLRKRPKGDKEVDVKRFVGEVRPLADGSGIEFAMSVTEDGTARPEEVIELLARLSEQDIAIGRVVRTGIKLREEAAPAPPRRRPPGRGGPGPAGAGDNSVSC